MTDTRADRHRLAAWFRQEAAPTARAVSTFNAQLAAAALVAVDPTTFAADLYRRAIAADCAITSGTPTLTSAAAPFVPADVGTKVYVQGAGVAGAALAARILAYVSASQVTLDANAGTTANGAPSSALVGIVVWGYTLDQISTDASYAQNSAGVTLGDVGAAIAAHAAAVDPHADRAYADAGDSAVSIAAAAYADGLAAVSSATRVFQRAAYQQVTQAGTPAAALDDTLQAACVAGVYEVEAEILWKEDLYVPSIATDVLVAGQQMLTAFSADVAACAFLGAQPNVAAIGTPVPIAAALNSIAGGPTITLARTTGQLGLARLRGYVVTSGPGTIGIIHCNVSGVANPIWALAGSWMRITRIG